MLHSNETAASLCPDCAELQRQPVQAEPHAALRRFTTVPGRRAKGMSNVARAVYRCRVCQAWLSRPLRSGPAMAAAWRLEASGAA